MTRQAGSITRLIPEVQKGDAQAIGQLWQTLCIPRPRGRSTGRRGNSHQARGTKKTSPRVHFGLFFDAAAESQAAPLESRDELWRLLVTISRRKAIDRVRHELRDRRGGQVRRENEGLTQAENPDATPSEVAGVTRPARSLAHSFRRIGRSQAQSSRTTTIGRRNSARDSSTTGLHGANCPKETAYFGTIVEERRAYSAKELAVPGRSEFADLPLSVVIKIDQLADEFESEWWSGSNPEINLYVRQVDQADEAARFALESHLQALQEELESASSARRQTPARGGSVTTPASPVNALPLQVPTEGRADFHRRVSTARPIGRWRHGRRLQGAAYQTRLFGRDEVSTLQTNCSIGRPRHGFCVRQNS